MNSLSDKNERLFIQCNCSTEGLEVYVPGDEPWCEISLWERHNSKRPFSWKERLRWMWQVLTTGDPWADYILMSKRDAAMLSTFLADAVAKGKILDAP